MSNLSAHRCYNCDHASENEAEHVTHKCLHEDVERVRRIRASVTNSRWRVRPQQDGPINYDALVEAHNRLGSTLNEKLIPIDIKLNWRDRVRTFFGRTLRVQAYLALDSWEAQMVASKASAKADPLWERKPKRNLPGGLSMEVEMTAKTNVGVGPPPMGSSGQPVPSWKPKVP